MKKQSIPVIFTRLQLVQTLKESRRAQGLTKPMPTKVKPSGKVYKRNPKHKGGQHE